MGISGNREGLVKPGGVSLHNFPSKWRPLEPHIFVPFDGTFRSYRYYRFWTMLGVGTKYGGGYTRLEMTEKYAEYGKSGLCYMEGRGIDWILSLCFDRWSYVSVILAVVARPLPLPLPNRQGATNAGTRVQISAYPRGVAGKGPPTPT